jgi:hypothetical protein
MCSAKQALAQDTAFPKVNSIPDGVARTEIPSFLAEARLDFMAWRIQVFTFTREAR